MNNFKLIKSQKGIVSLLTTIIISILLTIIGISMVVLSINEQRQSIDSDQSTAAYYAAEAGIEQGILAVKNAVKAGTPLSTIEASTCTNQYDLQAGTPTAPAQLGYTCQLIAAHDNKLIDHLQKDEATQIAPGPVGFTSIRLSWQLDGADNAPSGGYISPAGTQTAGINWIYPAVMELTALEYDSAAVTPASPGVASGVQIHTATVAPSGPGGGVSLAALGAATAQSANCGNAGGPYHCQVEISGFVAAKDYIIRLRPRYGPGHFKLEFLAGGVPVMVADRNATIDVTGKSGNVYRRIVASTPVQFGPAAGLDFVLFSDNDLCKDFFVSGNSAQSTNPQCPVP